MQSRIFREHIYDCLLNSGQTSSIPRETGNNKKIKVSGGEYLFKISPHASFHGNLFSKMNK